MTIFYDETGKAVEKPEKAPVLWRISAYGCVVKEAKILMVRAVLGNTWELPGGGVEIAESIADAVAREGVEETGCRLEVVGDLPLTVGERNFYSTPLQQFFHSLILVYPARMLDYQQALIPGDPKEIAAVEWVPLVELTEQNCHPIVWPAIKIIKEVV